MAGILSLHRDSSKCPFPIISWQLDVLKNCSTLQSITKVRKKGEKACAPLHQE